MCVCLLLYSCYLYWNWIFLAPQKYLSEPSTVSNHLIIVTPPAPSSRSLTTRVPGNFQTIASVQEEKIDRAFWGRKEVKENKTNVAHAESEKCLDRLVFSFLYGILPSFSRVLRVGKCCYLSPHRPLIITVVLCFSHPTDNPRLTLSKPQLWGTSGAETLPLPTTHPTRSLSHSLFQSRDTPPTHTHTLE